MKRLETFYVEHFINVMHLYRDALQSNLETINELNVYPVPDGDTGTNMLLTVESVIEALNKTITDSQENSFTMEQLCKTIAHSSLMGARGNSGVILSQILRAMYESFRPLSEIGPPQMAQALTEASKAAYSAVMKPVEGTILTVARRAGEDAFKAAQQGLSLSEILQKARDAGYKALLEGPKLMPVLAQAGVVDAGGSGFMLLLDSFLAISEGRKLQTIPQLEQASPKPVKVSSAEASFDSVQTSNRYEVMYLLEADDQRIEDFKKTWAKLGDSIVVVGGDGIWNCHIHSDEIGPCIEAGLQVGRPKDIRVTDLQDQVEQRQFELKSFESENLEILENKTAVVVVAFGTGLEEIFTSMGANTIIKGGQSHNPSTEELLMAIESAPGEEVIILPNNPNIISVAKLAAQICSKSAIVMPTTDPMQGFSCLMEYDPSQSSQKNAESMQQSLSRIRTGYVVQAVRDSQSPKGNIKKGSWMAMVKNTIEVIEPSLEKCCTSLLTLLLDTDSELITIITGQGSLEKSTQQILKWVGENFPDVAIEVHQGDQPLFPYLVGVE